jgi:hypothetical protein
MSRLGLVGLLVSFLFSFLCGSAGEAKAQQAAPGPTRVEALLQGVDGNPQLVLRALDLVQRRTDRELGLRLAEAVIAEEAQASVVAAALIQPAVAARQLEPRRARLMLGPQVGDLLDELTCPTGCVTPSQRAELTAHYTRFKAASRAAHLLEFHVRLDAARHLDGLELPLRLGMLRASRERVVPALRHGSPDLARRLDDELGDLIQRTAAELEDEVTARLAPFRRLDGTLRWSEVLARQVLQRTGEQPHFTLGLFLRELAQVVRSGSSERIEEFFHGLSRTDFFLQYGMFSLGSTEVAYSRYLERFVKPRFVHELLRTNVVLAAGVALPSIAAGTFQGEAFGINLTSLGLSSPATSRGLAALSWVQKANGLRAVKLVSHLSRLSKLSTLGGWVYTTAEILVVVYVTEQLQPRIRADLERKAAEDELTEAVLGFYEALGRRPTAERVRELGEAFHAAWTRYRDFLYAPMLAEEQRLNERLEALARRLKLISDERSALLDELPGYPALARHAESRSGSLADYVNGWLMLDDTREAEARVDEAIGDYLDARRRHLVAVYQQRRRPAEYLHGVRHPYWNALGARADAPEDPYRGKLGTIAERARAGSRADFEEAVCDVSENRLQTYEDERRALDLAIRALSSRPGNAAAVAALRELDELIVRTYDLDIELGRAVERGFVGTLNAGR